MVLPSPSAFGKILTPLQAERWDFLNNQPEALAAWRLRSPDGYCGIGGTDVKLGDPSEWFCAIGLTIAEE
ncbi:hypothetical protein MTP10_02100 [Nonomuraea sp. 3-1Str]|uniref:hypothetical protein n=1 Tax=Nonomuraea sp. 3-1Str TaxID=2929801 RepID=UPI002857AA6B|nr:hypothetical protein [Nonomuraea sp. 3-1Str]MDR8407529.1 hypothetical protein [Nonomuraea sp. 3-1Str]